MIASSNKSPAATAVSPSTFRVAAISWCRPHEGEYRDVQTKIGTAGVEKGTARGVRRFGPLKPETDQQVTAQANQLPGGEHQNPVAGQNQGLHGGNKQGHNGKKAG